MRKLFPAILVLGLIPLLCVPAYAQRLTGSIYGVITDSTGAVLPGVTVTVTGEAIMGELVYVSSEKGLYRFPAVAPGTCTITAELTGFQTVEITGIVINAGLSAEVPITMSLAGVEEVLTVTGESPTVDVTTSKLATTMTSELLENVPMARDLYDIVNAAPGVVSENVTYRRTSYVHGSTVRGNTYAFDGVNMNDPVVMYPLTNINFDVMEEVEMVTGGHPAEVGYTDGGYVNIVTKSGGNTFHGAGTVYYTSDKFAETPYTRDQLDAFGTPGPVIDTYWLDASGSLGGPIAKDKLWFFGNLRRIKYEQASNFIPWTDGTGFFHDNYDWSHTEKMGFIKLTGQLGEKMRIMGQYNRLNLSRPMYEQPAWNTTLQGSRKWDGETSNTINAIGTYVVDPNTFVEVRAGFVRRWFPLPMQDEAQGLPNLYEASTGHDMTTARFNETYLRKRFQVGGYLTKFVEDVGGGAHELKGGVELENAYGDWDWYRQDNLVWYWYDGSPYYYGYDDGVGRGRIYFYICGPESGSTHIKDKADRLGFYVQDTMTYGRLTVNAGVRFDRSSGWKPGVTKQASGNPVSVYLGETLVRPEYGLNPWGELEAPEHKDIMTWNNWSPRISATFDITGDAKTALKTSFNRYTEYLMLQYFSVLHPFYPRSFRFWWWDENNNQQVDIADRYQLYPSDFRVMDAEFQAQRLDPATSSPITHEFIIGIQREVATDFSIGATYIYKHKKNVFEDVRYAVDANRFWYTADQAPEWWIPFTTIIPGTDEYPDETVTFYAQSNDAPATFYQASNAEDIFRKYQALELTFSKRMSNNWQLAGSAVFSKAYGTIGGGYGSSWGWSGAADSPNWYVNRDGRIDNDRPTMLKFFGTYQLPADVNLSAMYRFSSGEPWTRYAYIDPPDWWDEANNALDDWYGVNIEQQGNRRRRNESYVDLRLEKMFDLGGGTRLGLYFDAFNVLGWTDVRAGLDDIYVWSPDAENTTEGSKRLEGSYRDIEEVRGVRSIKFSFRILF